ncbi:hypothetical protein VFPPC_13600 [Pochonia chlamydosporia 170]|uniref:BTB domain-containing protein n=1 Tax=Pochonia chlamydosporia 170 TaxID=1380566 RepID=A0A179FRE7_METCM|nr:hypothetical protein VFPPC_13600 [Pochonia chlamydosporia 170]OAQ67937.1 hypothetical protein VFPPC_13600 [Pochonia chlamydosporia 170]
MSSKRTKIGDDGENEDENPYASLLPDMASSLLCLRNTTAESIFSSRPIKFVVGTKRAEFWIHSSLVTGQSPVLDRLMNWKTNDTVFLDTADETAFLCFSLYAHTGFYDPRKILNAAPPQGSVDEWRLRLACHAKTYNFAD